MPTPNGGPRRFNNPATRRVLVVAAAILLLGGGTYGFTLTGDHSKTGGASPTPPQPSVVPPTGKCVVSYAVFSDVNRQFKAEVTLANRAETAVKDWKLWFIMPGDQTVVGNGKMKLTQEQHAVTVSTPATLKPQTTLTLPITGKYTAHNNAPLAFKLNGATCETFVSASPGEPSRKVEHLSNGQVRLSTTPPTSAPVPGISIDPGGIVRITPTTAPAVALPGVTTTPAVGVTTTAAVPTTATTTTTAAVEEPTTKPTTTAPLPTPVVAEDPTTTPPTTEPTTEDPTPAPPTTMQQGPSCDEEPDEPDCVP